MYILIFYLSYLSLPFFVFLCYFIFKNYKKLYKRKRLLFFIILCFLITILFIYARFVERNIIVVQNTSIKTGFSDKVIVISDMHLGVYKDQNFLKKIVNKINEQKNIDAVLIPGDFTFDPPKDLLTLFSPLKDIHFPVYAVLGNHDSEMPGPPIQKQLQEALEKNGVIFLNNTSSVILNKNITVLGLGDNFAYQDDISKIEKYSIQDNLIVLTHNPDTTLNYKNSIPDITISGHTHGGQIRIPFLYKFIIPCVGNFDKGLHNTPTGKIFVTSGLGETGLPLRLGIPPVIDVLEFY
ncbi:metallophosphoesterase [Patescibacteria group bacterium]|nr:metallophosphoesterase [Patescibacteria group bacterium]